MFIDVTRYGGMRVMRLAAPAIAYLDAVDGGAAIHLIGGETLRVNEDPAEIEARALAAMPAALADIAEPEVGEILAAEGVDPAPESAAQHAGTQRYPAKPKPGRRRQ